MTAPEVVALHLGRLRRHEAGARDGRDPEDLHRARVAARRLRAALRVFSEAFDPEARGGLVADLRWLGRRLGTVRDLDVQIARLAANGARLGPPAAAGVARLGRELGAAREAARASLGRALDAPRYARLLARLDAWVVATEGGDGRQVAAALERAERRFRRAGRRACERPAARSLHELRIRAKRLRYALEFLGEAPASEGRRVVGELTRLQDLLGAHQDAVVGARLARRALRSAPPRRARTGLEALVREEARLAREARARFLERWPAFRSRAFKHAIERAIARAAPAPDKKKGDAVPGVP